jgi:radical SAM superfamily enzyme YgiQ (UPF0313 family)
LAYISATLRKLGYEGETININEYDGDYINREFAKKVTIADVILCGGLSGHYKSICTIIREAKKIKPEIIAIVGGGVISAQPELTSIIGADIGVMGEGEQAITEVFRMIENGEKIPKGNVISCKEYVDMDTLPLPDYESLIRPTWLSKQRPTSTNYSYLFDNPRILPIVTTRGCPFNCTFCFSPLGRTYRERSIPKVLEDVEYLRSKFNINILNVYDEVMALKKDRLTQFCAGIKKFNLKWVTEFRLSLVDRDLVRMLKDVGCYIINVGIENVNEEILTSMNKGTNLKMIEEVLSICYEEKMGVCGNVLMFDAAETLKTVDFSLNWLCNNKRYAINCVPVQPYPGSPIFKRYVKEGLINAMEYVEKGCPFPIKPPVMSEEEFKEGYKRYLNHRRYGEGIPSKIISFEETGVEYRGPLYKAVVVCPHCGVTVTYNNILYATWAAATYPEGERVRIACRNCNVRFDIVKPCTCELPSVS